MSKRDEFGRTTLLRSRDQLEVVAALVSSPGWTRDNSPALECWVGRRPEALVQAGTAELNVRLCRPSGTGTGPAGCPVLKHWAILGRPCGTGAGTQNAVARK